MYLGNVFRNGLDAQCCKSALNPVVMEIMSSVNKYFSWEILASRKSDDLSKWLKATHGGLERGSGWRSHRLGMPGRRKRR